MEIHPIARIHSDFPGKFGIPRQSGLVPELRSRLRLSLNRNTAIAMRSAAWKIFLIYG